MTNHKWLPGFVAGVLLFGVFGNEATASTPKRSPTKKRTTSANVATAHILFTGMVTLNHESGEEVKDVTLFGVPPSRARACPDDPECDIPAHAAFISVDSGDDVVAPKLKRKPHGSYNVYYLSGPVRIHVDGIQGSPVPITDKPEPGNLYYVPRLSAINHRECKRQAQSVNARMDTPSGTFTSYVFDSSPEEFFDHHVSQAAVYKQCTAKIVDWEIQVLQAANGSPQLVLLKSNGKPLMTITHHDPSNTRPIVIVMGNAPPGGVVQALKIKKAPMDESDPHFDAYYNYCDATDLTRFPIPFMGSGKCATDTAPPYFPDWLKPFSPQAIGGFDCGPDQVP